MGQKYDPTRLERLSFRRQFILGPRPIDGFPSWRRVALDRGFHLYAHPDLDVQRATRGARSITLVGYAIDAHRPGAGNEEIVSRLLECANTAEGVLRAVDGLGGRWVLVVEDGEKTLLFTDAVGLRQAYHTVGPAPGEVWCASQPGLLAEVLGLAPDAGAVDFTQTTRYVDNRNASTCYPVTSTPYRDTKLLLPNHCLDLGTGQAYRYWPHEDLAALGFEEGVDACLRLWRGLVEGARRRFKLSVAMTAGWDSRLVLASTRHMAKDVFYFSGIFWNMTEEHPDAAAPTRLLAGLGLKNNLVPCRQRADEGFRRVFHRNVVMAHDDYAPIAEAVLEHCPPDSVCMKGDAAEIAKCYLRLDKRAWEITPEDLAQLSEMDPHPFALEAFGAWLKEVPGSNVHLLDLFCWEQAMGSLEALVEAECDIAQDAFTPFNCRELLTTMLRVDEKYRRAPTYWLFRELIERMWAATLKEPINGEAQVGTKAAVRSAIRRSGVQHWLPASIKGIGRRWLL